MTVKTFKKSWRRALGEKSKNPITETEGYTHDDFLDCTKYIEGKYRVTPKKLSTNTYEISFYPTVDFCRLIYDPEHKRIVVSYHTQTPITEAIIFFTSMRVLWPNIALMLSYYIDYDNKFYTGEDAEATMWSDFEEIVLNNFMAGAEDPIVDKYLSEKARSPKIFSETDKYKAIEYFLRMPKQEDNLN